MAVAVPSTLPMKLRKVEPRGKGLGSGGRARVLVTVTVLGSAGPLRFLVDEGDTVTSLIRSAATPARAACRCSAPTPPTCSSTRALQLTSSFPIRSVLRYFCTFPDRGRSVLIFTLLPCRAALKADERISFNGCRSFLLWQNASRKDAAEEPGSEPLAKASTATTSPARKGGGGGWKGLNKFLNFGFKV